MEKIQIIKCSGKYSWYKNFVNTQFLVEDNIQDTTKYRIIKQITNKYYECWDKSNKFYLSPKHYLINKSDVIIL